MLQPLAQTEKAFRGTSIAFAEGSQFDDIARNFGLPRIATFSVRAWRKALRAVGYGPRGIPGALQALLEGMFWDDAVTYNCELDGNSQIIFDSGGPLGASGFTPACVNRLWRLEGSGVSGLYWSIGPDFNGFSDSNYLVLCPVGTAYWRGADWSTATGYAITATLLGFIYRELDTCTIEVFISSDLATPPATYMQTLYQWGAQTTPDAPGTVWLVPGDVGVDAAAPVAAVEFTVLAEDAGTYSGLQVNCDAPAAPRGGDHVCTLLLNGAPTTLVATLGTSDAEAVDATHSVALVAGDVLSLKVVAGTGVTTGLVAPRVVLFRDPPTGTPEGGDVLDVLDDPADGGGPYPIYLTDDSASEIAAVIDALQASGVQVSARMVDFATFAGVP